MDLEANSTPQGVPPTETRTDGDSANQDSLAGGQSNWRFFGRRIPKGEVVFATQTLMLYIVIIVCLVNLTMGRDDSNLWTALLSSSLGLMLPSPTMKRGVRNKL
jgi:hypothetical protein